MSGPCNLNASATGSGRSGAAGQVDPGPGAANQTLPVWLSDGLSPAVPAALPGPGPPGAGRRPGPAAPGDRRDYESCLEP